MIFSSSKHTAIVWQLQARQGNISHIFKCYITEGKAIKTLYL
jgi:hypothetical protein